MFLVVLPHVFLINVSMCSFLVASNVMSDGPKSVELDDDDNDVLPLVSFANQLSLCKLQAMTEVYYDRFTQNELK